jgi:stage II sporulation SpoM-like protein
MVKTEELALVQGWADTQRTLVQWRRRPAPVLLPWIRGAFAVAAVLLLTVLVVASLVPPDPTGAIIPGVQYPARFHDFAFVLYRNGLVLALHALACVAGFMAGSSLPVVAEGYSGVWRKIHEKAGPLAIGFVICATVFSLFTQALALGVIAADAAHGLNMPPALLIVGLLPHAVPELAALFLPLAAWTLAARRKAWDELLAATFVTVAIAVPVLLAAAAVETWVSPDLVAILSEASAP